MKILFIADPIAKLKPAADSTLAMLRESLRRGWDSYWAVPEDLEYRGGAIRVAAQRVLACGVDSLPRLEPSQPHWMRDLQAVFIRKDPPFDASYVRLCWLLALEESKVAMFNRASLLLRYHEKLIPLEAMAQGFLTPDDLIPTHIGNLSTAKTFVQELGAHKIVAKPFLGFGGNRVVLQDADLFQKWAPAPAEHEELLVQPFYEAILKRGDRRVFFLAGLVIGDFVRMPAAGGFVSNLAQGGSAVALPMEAQERAVLERLGKFLAHAGIVFAGADLIGRKISEVNITSPTGIRNLMKLEGRDISRDLMDYVAGVVA